MHIFEDYFVIFTRRHSLNLNVGSFVVSRGITNAVCLITAAFSGSHSFAIHCLHRILRYVKHAIRSLNSHYFLKHLLWIKSLCIFPNGEEKDLFNCRSAENFARPTMRSLQIINAVCSICSFQVK
jgi:hypothetical protein